MVTRNRCDVTYEQIENEFYYAWYLDLRVVMNKNNGWINATRLCEEHGKRRFGNWAHNAHTQRLIKTFQMEHPATQSWETVAQSEIFPLSKIYSGTYIPPLLAPALALWLSPDFYYQACKILHDSISEKWKLNCKQLKKEMENYEQRLHRSETLADDIGNMIEQLTPDVAPKPKNTKLYETFMLHKINDCKFHMTRCQKRNAKKAIRQLLDKYPSAELVMDIAYTPNAKNIQHRFRESLDSTENVRVTGNEIIVEEIDNDLQVMLINRIKDISTSLM